MNESSIDISQGNTVSYVISESANEVPNAVLRGSCISGICKQLIMNFMLYMLLSGVDKYKYCAKCVITFVSC